MNFHFNNYYDRFQLMRYRLYRENILSQFQTVTSSHFNRIQVLKIELRKTIKFQD